MSQILVDLSGLDKPEDGSCFGGSRMGSGYLSSIISFPIHYAGGAGFLSSITGSPIHYAGGGFGNTSVGLGGNGGGAPGGGSPCTNGGANTGGGSGGTTAGTSCSGGSGIVIIRYIY